MEPIRPQLHAFLNIFMHLFFGLFEGVIHSDYATTNDWMIE
jgi:hypothetical protein